MGCLAVTLVESSLLAVPSICCGLRFGAHPRHGAKLLGALQASEAKVVASRVGWSDRVDDINVVRKT